MSSLDPAGPESWIQTYTGRQFWPLAPRTEDVCIEDIAHALAHQCRFSGHTSRFYSVAEHSVVVSRHAGCAAWGLMHDAAEAYLLDIPRPIKAHLPRIRKAEVELLATISAALGLPEMTAETNAEIAELDMRALATERRDLMAPWPAEWTQIRPGLEPFTERIAGWAPRRAEFEFLRRWHEISGDPEPWQINAAALAARLVPPATDLSGVTGRDTTAERRAILAESIQLLADKGLDELTIRRALEGLA